MDEGFSKISIICLLGALLLDQGAHLLDVCIFQPASTLAYENNL